MTTTTFTDGQTLIKSSWLNDINTVCYGALGSSGVVPTNGTQVIANLGLSGGAGAGSIGYTPSGTGAVATTVQAKLQQTVSVTDFGADPTGVADSTAAFNAAITAMNLIGGGTVMVPAGTYLALSIAMLSNVTLELRAGATIKKNGGAGTTQILNFTGTVSGTTSALTANASVGNNSVTVTNGALFSVGQYVLVYDLTYAYGTTGRNQEIQQIQSIASNVITFYNRITGSYATASTATLAVLSAVVNSHIKGPGALQVPVGTSGGCILQNYSYNCTMDGVELIGFHEYPGIRFDSCNQFKVTNNRFHDGQGSVIGGTSGLAVVTNEASYYGLILGNSFVNYNQILITNNSQFITFAVNSCNSSIDDSVNTHGSGNKNILITGNQILNGGQYGIGIGFNGDNAPDTNIVISNNIIVNTYNTAINIGGNNVDIKVVGNQIYKNETSSSGLWYGIFINTGSSSVDVSNNFVDGTGATTIDRMIYLVGVTDATVNNNTCQNNSNNYGIGVNGCTRVDVINNKVKSIASYTYYINGVNSTCRVLGNASDTTTTSIDTATYVDGNSWQMLTGSATYTPGTLVTMTGVTTTISVTGALLGDYVTAVSNSVDLQGVTLTAYVSSSGVVTARFFNSTTGSITLSSATLAVRVTKKLGVG